MKEDILKVLLSENEIAQRVSEIGAQISRDYAGKRLVMVSVLKGSVVFMADLMRAVTVPAEIDFMCVSSYGNGVKTSGVVRIIKDLDNDLAGMDLLLVEDILDSGMTLSYIKNFCSTAIQIPCVFVHCLISRNGARQILSPIIKDLTYQMNLS